MSGFFLVAVQMTHFSPDSRFGPHPQHLSMRPYQRIEIKLYQTLKIML